MTQPTAFFSKKVLLPEGLQPAFILIENGKIAQVTSNKNDLPDGCPIEDIGGHIILPGLMDPHVHINEPGRTEWEGFETATKAAASGGITTLVDMPLNATPVTTTIEGFQKKLGAAEGKLRVDCGFWGGVVPGNAKDMEPLIKAGVLGFKTFLTHSGIDDFPNATEQDLRLVMPTLAKYQLPLLVHAELETSKPENKLEQDPKSYQNYLASRPDSWEIDAIKMMIQLAKEFDSPVHIVHLSSAKALPILEQAKNEGLKITVETCPQYLLFTAEEIPDGDTRFKCAPPIRSAKNREELWKALQNGLIDFIATDHSPCTPNLKLLEDGNFMKAWGGIASLGLILPTLWTECKRREIPITDLAKWLCTGPAQLAGLAHQKGKIAPGRDADLAIWDPDPTWEIEPESLYFRHPLSPYLGRKVTGKVKKTLLRGSLIFEEGTPLDEPQGKPLLRSDHV